MALEFAGPATPLDDKAIKDAASAIGCAVAAIRAVIDVESQGGFLPDGRPKILFERHYFSRLTSRRHDSTHPDISHPTWGGYLGGAREYGRLTRAMELDRDAALRSASWGAFQIMGDNHALCGFASAGAFAEAMVSGAPAQLRAFVSFIRNTGLAGALIRADWAAFARGYNGPAYKANKYDEKLAAAYRRHSARDPQAACLHPLLRQGDTGEAVKALQQILGLKTDGSFGPKTRQAVVGFQARHGLQTDGIVGPKTWAQLPIDCHV